MNNKTACIVLNIKEDENLTRELLKRKFRCKALEYHPDKNNSENANAKFQEVKEAYDLLNAKIGNENIEMNYNYADLLYDFLKDTIELDKIKNKLVNTNVFNIIIDKITHSCEEKITNIIEKIDKEILIELYRLVTTNKAIFKYIDKRIIDKMKQFIDDKTKFDERIILNPTIEDLLECNVYKFKMGEKRFIIPLWHDELIYDLSGSDLYVTCNPIIDDIHIIDEYSNLHVKIIHNIKDLWNSDNKIFKIGKKELKYNPSELKIKYYQTITFKKEGIPRSNPKDIYNIKNKGDIILHIYIII